ncbi:Retrograde transport protein Dsl1 C-terminal [Penicillium macrosclerotiorum]|uniref:Retrograde transport protein Dsl1 C-terminal n=1 Tax=Penicillium macrosclerotiorum TaxID=303699 RepID=UPI00254988C6|nr:Retrograde transport protein Dsl1 C-terminal [Penicillium macrosclerotiorum]KAJ5673821.1 Retrograde transport protein Dsl1 C-terminal [Penicillium macrosclerotiorum]
MSRQASEDELCQAVLNFVTDGAYPEETLVAAQFPAAALTKELELISKARKQVEDEISSLSRENTTFDADDWIIQAKQLHADIERSRVTAREIVAQHEQTKPLRSKVEDASAKVGLIETEIAFNQAVTDTLEEVQRLCQQLESGRAALATGQISAAIKQLELIDGAIGSDTNFAHTNVMGILSTEVARLRQEIEDALRLRWSKQLNVDRQKGEFQITKGDAADSLDDTIEALSRLEILPSATDKFLRDLTSIIIDPILLPRADGSSRGVSVTDASVHLEPDYSITTVSETLNHVAEVLSHLRQNLPPSISVGLSQTLVSAVASKAISGRLSSVIPTTLAGLDEFEKTLDHVLQFTKTIESWGWTGQEELVSWVNQAPRLWLTQRRVDSLDRVRKILAASKGSTMQVEWVEKEVFEADEALLQNATADDDWDVNWDDDKEEQEATTHEKNAQSEDDEEDVSAWGLDDAQEESKPDSMGPIEDDGDGDDAWGWGEEDEEDKGEKNPESEDTASLKPANGEKIATSSAPREVTLKEVYTVTDIPDSVLGIIQQQITDSKNISQPPYSTSRVASSGAGLLALPTLILAMFKATSSTFYSLKLESGQMYLYNDTLYLAGQVRELVERYELSRLGSDVEALEKFGKFAYSKEMQTQSTIVTDLLDGAQGFGQCSQQPFKTECENAVSATVDRIRDVYKEWQPILSHSALLQSIGSLLSTVINKIIIDVEDLGDISEDQSKQLVAVCNQVTKLENLFMPKTTGDAEAVPITAVYVPNWLRFQYLINILESSLADIKFLWLEGELGLEFSMDEVIDLIEALFAESDYRRRAIADIRRAPR